MVVVTWYEALRKFINVFFQAQKSHIEIILKNFQQNNAVYENCRQVHKHFCKVYEVTHHPPDSEMDKTLQKCGCNHNQIGLSFK